MVKNKYNLIIIVLGLVFVLSGCLNKDSKIEDKNDKQPVVVNDQQVTDQSTKVDNSEVKNDEIDTGDWLTYRNEELGFEVKYPKRWFVDGSSVTSYDPSKVSDKKSESFKSDKVKIEFFVGPICGDNKLIFPCMGTMEEYDKGEDGGLAVYTFKKDVKYDDVVGIYKEGKIIGVVDALASVTSVYFVKKTQGYLFSYSGDHSLKYQEIFKTFLSTIHFLK